MRIFNRPNPYKNYQLARAQRCTRCCGAHRPHKHPIWAECLLTVGTCPPKVNVPSNTVNGTNNMSAAMRVSQRLHTGARGGRGWYRISWDAFKNLQKTERNWRRKKCSCCPCDPNGDPSLCCDSNCITCLCEPRYTGARWF